MHLLYACAHGHVHTCVCVCLCNEHQEEANGELRMTLTGRVTSRRAIRLTTTAIFPSFVSTFIFIILGVGRYFPFFFTCEDFSSFFLWLLIFILRSLSLVLLRAAEKTGTEENISQLRDKEETESLIYHPGSGRLHVYAAPWSRMFVCMLGRPATDTFQ